MPEKFSKVERSRIMSRIHSKNTKCELELRQALRKAGLRNYRIHYPVLIGKPDIVFIGKKIAIFCDSDFWHGRKGLPASNQQYWREKLRKNVERDALVNQTLCKSGWKVLRFSESEILINPTECTKKIIDVFESPST
jgi:DNA mismatch endonuclease, patch repair protein